MLSAFGSPPRGVSFYSDQLFTSLQEHPGVDIGKLDYVSLYPSILLPTSPGDAVLAENAVVSWNRPATWRKAASLSAPVMHMQYWTFLSAHYLAAIARHLHRQQKKCVVTVHNPDPHEAVPVAGYLESKLFKVADRLIVHSESGKNILCRKQAALEPKIRVIPHGIVEHGSIDIQPGDYELAGLSAERRYVLIFGNLRGYKGIPTLLRAWKDVIRENTGTDLILAGRFWNKGRNPASRITARILGTEKTTQEINALLSDSALQHRIIQRTRFLPDEVIDACCRLADVAVFPYVRFSGQSGAATRAAGWGTPLIVSRVGALPDLAISDDYVCRPFDEVKLAAKLLHLLSRLGNVTAMRQEQLAIIRPFYWDNVAARTADVYKELTG
jgi:glycosyltransferase involved in cell wall biosynthesis